MLIVDDDRMLLGILADIVGALGHEVDAHVSTAAALAAARGAVPDVALIDLNIPGDMPGRALLEEMLALNPALQAIVLSGSADPEVEAEIRRLGAHFLGKPVSLDVLERAIARATSAVR